jgi:pimeloyl-ACP methyl ester carboxylesterase
MPTVMANGIDIHYETFGDPEDPALLLVMGLGAQMIAWDVEFCLGLVDRGFHVIRYDNRDTGLSTHVSDARVDVMAALMAANAGEPVDAPYLLSDMARDGMALLDELGIERAHIVGASMGGMIVQTMAIEHPQRVQSLTSIMSNTGEREFGQPTGEALQALLAPPAQNREQAIERSLAGQRVIGSPDHLDEDRIKARAAAAFDRAFDPPGLARQLVAINASGSRPARPCRRCSRRRPRTGTKRSPARSRRSG